MAARPRVYDLTRAWCLLHPRRQGAGWEMQPGEVRICCIELNRHSARSLSRSPYLGMIKTVCGKIR